LVQHQQPRVNGHDQSEVQLGHHALRQFPYCAAAPDVGLRKKAFRLRAIESRMHTGDIVKRLRNPHPARQHGNIGNERDIPHELIALRPGVASEHLQFSLIWGEAENRVERRGLACAVGTNEPEDAALFNTQVDAVQRDRCAERLTETACFYPCHGFIAPPLSLWLSTPTREFSTVRHPKTTGQLRRPAVLPLSGRAAEWLRGSWAILRQETSAVRPAATDCARPH